MQASEFIWLHCFTHSLERLSPFYYSFHNICFCPLLLASHYFQSTLFSFQGAGYFPVFFKTRLKHLIAQVLQPKLEAALLKFSLLPFSFKRKEVVGPSGLEPPTSRLSVVRSSQLSYGPVLFHRLRCAPSKLNNVKPSARSRKALTLGRYNRACSVEVSLERR